MSERKETQHEKVLRHLRTAGEIAARQNAISREAIQAHLDSQPVIASEPTEETMI
jgi:hypothetical protein